MHTPSRVSNDKDIEMGIPGDLPISPPKQKNCWGKTFTDFSMGLEVVICSAAAVGAVWSYVYSQYIVAGICTGIFVVSGVNSIRIHCLGKLKDQNKQNEKLAHNINSLSKEKLDLENELNTLQNKITQIEEEKQEFAKENSEVNESLNKKVKEIKKLNANLEAAEKKAAEFETLYEQFKTLQAELSKQTSDLLQDDNDLHRINLDLNKEKNKTDNITDNINSNNKKFDSENQQFSGKLKEFQQLLAITQQQLQLLQKSYTDIKNANVELQKNEAKYQEREKQNALIADHLKQTEARLSAFSQKFLTFIAHLRTLSESVPQLKPLLENIDSKN
jgi:chromosome segregation ATPase